MNWIEYFNIFCNGLCCCLIFKFCCAVLFISHSAITTKPPLELTLRWRDLMSLRFPLIFKCECLCSPYSVQERLNQLLINYHDFNYSGQIIYNFSNYRGAKIQLQQWKTGCNKKILLLIIINVAAAVMWLHCTLWYRNDSCGYIITDHSGYLVIQIVPAGIYIAPAGLKNSSSFLNQFNKTRFICTPVH